MNYFLYFYMMKKIVTFDFDSTLTRADVQEYAKELIARGIEVWVLTSRYDDLHVNRYNFSATNDDLWEVVDNVGIPRHQVRFQNMVSKSEFLFGTKVIWHLDDDSIELYEIRNMKLSTKGIQVEAGSWKQKCEKFIK